MVSLNEGVFAEWIDGCRPLLAVVVAVQQAVSAGLSVSIFLGRGDVRVLGHGAVHVLGSCDDRMERMLVAAGFVPEMLSGWWVWFCRGHSGGRGEVRR